MSNHRAFSLAEILVALAVVVVGMLALAGSVIYSLRADAGAGRKTQALYYASQLLNLSKLYNLPRVAPINDPPGARVALNAPPFAAEVPADSLFQRNLRMQPVTADTTDYRHELYRVDVTVFWFEQKGEQSLSVSSVYRLP